MDNHQTEERRRDHSADERQPLLDDSQSQTRAHGSIDGQQDESAPEAQDTPLAREPSTTELAITLGSIWVGVFLAALDSTIIATLSAPISASFSSFTLLSWLASAYLIANAALQPLSGKLTDIFSRRTGLIWSNLFFGAGNLICGLAKSEIAMILGRVVSGMGGGGLTAIATFVASDLVPLRRRGLWQGFGNLVFGLGSGIGGVYGGFINDTIGWRWAFLFQVPLVIIAGLLAHFTVKVPVKETETSRIKRVDFLGAITLTLTLVLLLLGLNSGGNVVPWSHPLVLTTLPLSFVCLLVYVYVEDCIAVEPVIPVRLLLDRTVLSACFTNFFATMAIYALLYYGLIYFQVRGASATSAGLRLIPHSLGIMVGSLGTGLITRRSGKYWRLNAATEVLLVAAAALIAATFDRNTPVWPPYIYFGMAGVGYSAMLTITLLALISAVEHKHQAVITSASYAFRSAGSTIGITVAGAVFQNTLKSQLWARFGDRHHAAEIIGRVRDNIDEIKNLPPGWYEGVLDSFVYALRGVWMTTLGLTVLGALISLTMKEHVLHTNLARK